MMQKINPKVNLKLQYKRVLEIGIILSLILHIAFLQGYKKMAEGEGIVIAQLAEVQIEEIAVTEQRPETVAPSRPTIPIMAEDDMIPDEDPIDIMDFDLDFMTLPPPPSADEGDDDIFAFIPYDEPPEPIGGYAAIARNLRYPDIAQRAGIEGTVVVRAQIDVDGRVLQTVVIESLTGCDDAAVEAVRRTRWRPAMQRDQPVRVWVSIPVVFQLQ